MFFVLSAIGSGVGLLLLMVGGFLSGNPNFAEQPWVDPMWKTGAWMTVPSFIVLFCLAEPLDQFCAFLARAHQKRYREWGAGFYLLGFFLVCVAFVNDVPGEELEIHWEASLIAAGIGIATWIVGWLINHVPPPGRQYVRRRY